MMRNTQKYVIHNETFELDCRYSDVNLIGRGGYGAVISAFDCIRNEKVAIKKISHVFGDDRNIKAKRTLREIKLLHHFHAYNNIVSIHDLMTTPPNTNEIEDIYIVLQLFDSDLDQIISSPQPLSDSHNKYFMYQILRGLKNLHSANVIHRDLKPSNILVNANCDIALTDFGLSRGLSGGAKEDLTEYVVTRNYRSPELLCDSSRYGKSVDIWSVGCIFLEIICRKRSLFIGKSPFHQLASIIETVGCPPCDELDFVEHPVIRDMITTSRNKVKQGEDPLRRMLPNNVEPEALDLLKKMLVVKPEDRISVEDALLHPFFIHLHKAMRTDTTNISIKSFYGEYEKNDPMSRDDLKEMFADEMKKISQQL